MKNYNFEDILNQIKSKETTLYFVAQYEYEEDMHGDELLGEPDVFFTGTSEADCTDMMHELAKNVERKKYRYTLFWAGCKSVRYDDLTICDNAEETIMGYLNKIVVDGDYFNHIERIDIVDEYDPIKGSILLNYEMDRLIGGQPKFVSVKYCIDDDATTLWCKPCGGVTVLVSRDEIEKMTKASELVGAIEIALNNRERIENNFDTKKFVADLCEWSEIFPHIYRVSNLCNDIKP